MLTRSTKIQLLVFVVITLVGLSYVSAQYIGLTRNILSNPCTVSADFPDSGGIFTNAEVTYRGVTVGRVGALHLIPNGIRVDLDIDDCDSPGIPASASAHIDNRSVIGEQYVNLIPPNDKPPYLHSGALIPMKRNTIPVPTQTLLVNLDKLVNSVPLNSLRTTISELDKAVKGRGPDLSHLLDSTNQLLSSALEPKNVQNTIALIDYSSTVLQTQLDERGPLQSWTHSLNLLSQQLKQSDPDIRHLLSTGPGDLGTVQSFIQSNRTDLGVLLANFDQLGSMLVRRIDGIEQVLELYPALAAGGESVLQNGQGRLGLVLQAVPDPQDCGDPNKGRQGYTSTRRGPENLSPEAPDTSVRCTAPASSGTNVRGSANVPGGDPVSTSGGGRAYPRAVTRDLGGGAAGGVGSTVSVGTSLMNGGGLGDASWLSMLTDAVR